MFKDINEAYTVLSDDKKRQRYDDGADIEDLDNEHGHGMGGMNPQDIFQMFFQQRGGGGGGGHHHHAGHGNGGGSYTFSF